LKLWGKAFISCNVYGILSRMELVKLAVQAGRKRQSPRTGFVHDGEVIPIYENYCCAFALFRQKTKESVLEGKALLERLLALQCTPVFFHDFPKCYDFQMPLKVAPMLIHLLRLFGPVLGDLKEKIEEALKRLTRPEKPAWENRYRACVGEPLLPVDTSQFSPQDWLEWVITSQLVGDSHFEIPYDEELQMILGHDVQEKAEPRPHPIDWALAEGKIFKEHPLQLLAAPLFPISFTPIPWKPTSLRIFWKGTTIHSLVGKGTVFDLPEGGELGFEASVFADINTSIFVEGKKATVFRLGDKVTVKTSTKEISLRFQLTQGEGDFCGHIFRSNRPNQIEKGYETYDWQIGVRTLRRTPTAQLVVAIE
jgi:hypothetical protein